MPNFKHLIKANRHEEDIKKSSFIGICFPINSIASFEDCLSRFGDSGATHNCWAYRLGNQYRFSDDGEPSGTAGQPILAAIDGAGFDAVGALVIRYYGGIKLGTGGLARAYGGVIAKNLNCADYKWHVPTYLLQLQVPFAHAQSVHMLTEQFAGQIKQELFHSQGAKMQVLLPDKHKTEFKNKLNNISKGQIDFMSPT